MAKFPTYEEMVKRVAEKALDEFIYKGKTLREWVEIIVAQNLLVIAELEKIKAEIMATGNWKSEYEISDRGVIKAVEIIDKHISELKGE